MCVSQHLGRGRRTHLSQNLLGRHDVRLSAITDPTTPPRFPGTVWPRRGQCVVDGDEAALGAGRQSGWSCRVGEGPGAGPDTTRAEAEFPATQLLSTHSTRPDSEDRPQVCLSAFCLYYRKGLGLRVACTYVKVIIVPVSRRLTLVCVPEVSNTSRSMTKLHVFSVCPTWGLVVY